MVIGYIQNEFLLRPVHREGLVSHRGGLLCRRGGLLCHRRGPPCTEEAFCVLEEAFCVLEDARHVHIGEDGGTPPFGEHRPPEQQKYLRFLSNN